MTIGIAIAVPDGIALAADTQTTWNQTITKVKPKGSDQEIELAEPIRVPVGWSQRARKLFSVDMAGKTYAIVSAGTAMLNAKSMFAIFRSGAHSYSGNGSWSDVTEYFIKHIRQELAAHLACSVDELHKQPVNKCDFILAGYEEDDVAKPAIESHIVFSGTLTVNNQLNSSGYARSWSNLAKNSRYGGCWIGRTEYISHIVKHKNPNLPPISGQFQMMTLFDAVDYTRFLAEFTCDFQRFAVMVPDCGRPLTSATLTPEGYTENTLA